MSEQKELKCPKCGKSLGKATVSNHSGCDKVCTSCRIRIKFYYEEGRVKHSVY